MNLTRLTIILLVLAVIVRSDLFFVLVYITVGLQLAARLWVRYEEQHLSWRRSAPESAFPGEPIPVAIEVSNRGLLPIPWVSMHESLPPALHSPPMVREVLSLAPRERRSVRYTLMGRRRGYYQLGPLTLQTGDVLGLAERPLHADGRAGLTILPTVLPLADLGLPASLPYGTLASARRLFEDPARPAGVRPYEPADGVRRLDWKASAHAGQPLVRRRQPSIALETLVALAFARDEYPGRFATDAMERSLTAAASILAHMAELRQPFALLAAGRDPASGREASLLPSGGGRSHLLLALGVLGRLEPAEAPQLLPALRRAGAGLGWGSTIVIITGQPAEALLPDALALRRRGLNLTLVLAEAGPADLALPRRHGITAFGLTRAGEPTGEPA